MSPSEFDIHSQVTCAERELSKRRFFFPKWVLDGRLTQDKSDRELACMEAILITLRKLQVEARKKEELPLFSQPHVK